MMPHVICFGHIGSPFLCASICEINENTASGLGLARRTGGLVWWVTGSDIDARPALLAPVFTRRPHASPCHNFTYVNKCIIRTQFQIHAFTYTYIISNTRLYVYLYNSALVHIQFDTCMHRLEAYSCPPHSLMH